MSYVNFIFSQERLLLSVLPEHVAVQMRQDLDSADSQFKKIYMSRHENVRFVKLIYKYFIFYRYTVAYKILETV